MDINNLEGIISEYVPKELLNDVLNYLRLRFSQGDVDLAKLSVIGKGESSINFDLGNTVLRLTKTYYVDGRHMPVDLKEHVSHSNHILQPISEKLFVANGDIYTRASILEFPKLQMGDITDADIMKTYVGLRNDGYLWFDIKNDNLGKDAAGNVYLLDYGELHYLGEMNDYDKASYMKMHREMRPDYDAAYREIVSVRTYGSVNSDVGHSRKK